mgnify:CR=1 FL=1
MLIIIIIKLDILPLYYVYKKICDIVKWKLNKMKSYDDEDDGGRKHIKSNMVECFELIMQSLYVLQ